MSKTRELVEESFRLLGCVVLRYIALLNVRVAVVGESQSAVSPHSPQTGVDSPSRRTPSRSL